MTLNRREMLLLVATGMAVLVAGASFVLKGWYGDWQELRQREHQLVDSIAQSQTLVEERETWNQKLNALSEVVPVAPANKKMDVYWMGFIEALARKHDLKLLNVQPGNEQQIGSTYELPIEVSRCEGTLDAFVHFLFELEGDGAMIDVRYLRIRPKDDKLRSGRFSLYCAYTRE